MNLSPNYIHYLYFYLWDVLIYQSFTHLQDQIVNPSSTLQSGFYVEVLILMLLIHINIFLLCFDIYYLTRDAFPYCNAVLCVLPSERFPSKMEINVFSLGGEHALYSFDQSAGVLFHLCRLYFYQLFGWDALSLPVAQKHRDGRGRGLCAALQCAAQFHLFYSSLKQNTQKSITTKVY